MSSFVRRHFQRHGSYTIRTTMIYFIKYLLEHSVLIQQPCKLISIRPLSFFHVVWHKYSFPSGGIWHSSVCGQVPGFCLHVEFVKLQRSGFLWLWTGLQFDMQPTKRTGYAICITRHYGQNNRGKSVNYRGALKAHNLNTLHRSRHGLYCIAITAVRSY